MGILCGVVLLPIICWYFFYGQYAGQYKGRPLDTYHAAGSTCPFQRKGSICTTVNCPRCGGSGHYNKQDEGGFNWFGITTCTNCCGKGQVRGYVVRGPNGAQKIVGYAGGEGYQTLI